MRCKNLEHVKLVVVKLGSAVLTDNGHLNASFFTRFAGEIAQLRRHGYSFIVVTSGAVAAGLEALGFTSPPLTIPEKQACAAVGQLRLMRKYEQEFAAHDQVVAQVLLTADDIRNRRRYLNARNTLRALLGADILPLVNENDTVVVREIKFGDNDNLAALLTSLAEVDLLLLLTDLDGVYNCDPKVVSGASLIPLIDEVDAEVTAFACTSKSAVGSGGMLSKLEAARKAAAYGIPTVIANGRRPGVMSRVLAGEDEGTIFLPRANRLSCRQHWLAFAVKPRGSLYLDKGAVRALIERGTSLLPAGIFRVEGDFGVGEPVSCRDLEGAEIARGLVTYSSSDIKKIAGLHSREITSRLGYDAGAEVIHRDNLALL
ncbi:MAG: glutamate 5-kinase [Deltaproteobacteria bacterium]|nr:glutamate 5-kinase [Deltaproteobacteria bacterium]MCK5682246.1 glutamate 5-kinase [bacterium]